MEQKGESRSRSGSRGRSRTRSLVSRFTRSEPEYVIPNPIEAPSAPPFEQQVQEGPEVSPPPNLRNVSVGISDEVSRAMRKENERLNAGISQNMQVQSPPPLPNRSDSSTLEAIKDLTEVVKNMAVDIREVQVNQDNLRRMTLGRHNTISTMEEIPPPRLAREVVKLDGSVEVQAEEPVHLKTASLKKIKDLRQMLEYRFKPQKQNIADWLRFFAKKVAIMATDLHPALYNIILLDNLDSASQEQLHSFLGGRSIQDWTPSELHRIVLSSLGGHSTEIDRSKDFFAYHPSTDKTPPTTMSMLIHKVYSLGVAAGASQIQLYKKLLDVLPSTAKQELRTAIAAQRSFNPSYVPQPHELLELTSGATEAINQELVEIYGKKKNIRAVTTQGIQESDDLPSFGVHSNGDPNSNDRAFYPRLDKPPPDTCANCLQTGHRYSNCRFKVACLLCGGNHPAPICHIYKNKTPVQKACYHCSLKSVKLHHATADCLLIKEGQMQGGADAKNE